VVFLLGLLYWLCVLEFFRNPKRSGTENVLIISLVVRLRISIMRWLKERCKIGSGKLHSAQSAFRSPENRRSFAKFGKRMFHRKTWKDHIKLDVTKNYRQWVRVSAFGDSLDLSARKLVLRVHVRMMHSNPANWDFVDQSKENQPWNKRSV